MVKNCSKGSTMAHIIKIEQKDSCIKYFLTVSKYYILLQNNENGTSRFRLVQKGSKESLRILNIIYIGSKLIKNSSKWFRMVQNDSRPFKMVHNSIRWFK